MKRKKATVKTQVKDLKKGETIGHYNAVLLEDIRSKMEFILEAVDTTNLSLKKEMKQLREDVTNEVELLKSVIHEHSNDLKFKSMLHDNTANSVKENNLQIVETKKKVEELFEYVREKLGDRIEDHESRITSLEKAA